MYISLQPRREATISAAPATIGESGIKPAAPLDLAGGRGTETILAK